jgi:hypothetical protein
MEKNINALCSKLFKEKEEIDIKKLETLKQHISMEILYFKFNSHNLNINGKMGSEEFCKSILSNLVPSDAFSKIKQIDNFITSGKIKGDISFQDFLLINRFFNEYKKYFKIKKTSNFSRSKFKEVFKQFASDYKFSIENEQSIDNLFSLIDFDGNENLEFDELKKFMFRLNTGGRSEMKNQKTGIKPWNDFKAKMVIYQKKLHDIYEIIKR